MHDGFKLYLSVALTLLFALWSGVATGLALRFRDNLKQRRELNAKTYGFLRSFLRQEMVNDRLRELASVFEMAAQAQAKELSSPTDQAAIDWAEAAMKTAKEAFWDALNGAKLYGFDVQSSVKDYLPTKPR